MTQEQDDSARPQVAFLGPVASFSHQAALEYFGESADLLPHNSFSAVFDAVQFQDKHASTIGAARKDGSKITHAIVPIENSSNGTVVSLLDLLADPEDKYPSVQVCAEYYLSVHHCLLAAPLSTSSPDDVSIEERIRRVKTLHTHPQVWTQCTRYLSAHLAGAERIDTSSTSAAAKYLTSPQSQPRTGADAAIGSALAASTFNLDILASNIEDDSNNTTRFLVLRNASSSSSSSSASPNHRTISNPTLPEEQPRNSKPNLKSLLTFTLNHSLPGSLADALRVFRDHGLNLTSIDTRPSRKVAWHYIFCVECERKREEKSAGKPDVDEEGEAGGGGRRRQEEAEEQAAAAPDAPPLKEMLAALAKKTETCRYLGTWEDALVQPRR